MHPISDQPICFAYYQNVNLANVVPEVNNGYCKVANPLQQLEVEHLSIGKRIKGTDPRQSNTKPGFWVVVQNKLGHKGGPKGCLSLVWLGGVFGRASRPKNWFPLTIEPCALVELWFPHVFVLFFCVIGFHHLFVGTNLFAKYGNQTTKAKDIWKQDWTDKQMTKPNHKKYQKMTNISDTVSVWRFFMALLGGYEPPSNPFFNAFLIIQIVSSKYD